MATSKATERMLRGKRLLVALAAAGVSYAIPGLSQAVSLDDEASSGTAKRAWTIEPRISLTETYTDKVNVGQGGDDSDLITQVSPGVRIQGDTARLKVNADYSLRGIMYANNSDENEIQHALNAFGTLEAVEDWLYVDASGVVTQQLISAFGPSSPDDSSINDNTAQTSNFRVSPYIKGKLGGFANYQLRYSRSWAQSDTGTSYDTDIADWSGNLAGDTGLAKLGWSIDGGLQNYDYSGGRETESDRLRGSLIYRHDPRLNFTLSVGRESNDFISLQKETYTTHGFGFDWRPTPRTEISAFREERFFGNGHSLKFKHRMKRAAIQFSDTRDVSGLPNSLTTVGMGTYYDMIYSMLSASYPDETERAQQTEALLSLFGIPYDAVVTGNFLTSQVYLQRRQELSLVLSGVRNTVTVAVSRSQNEGLSTVAIPGDDFSTYNDITQEGISASWSHRLTPQSTLGANIRFSKTSGTTTGGGENDSDQRQYGVTYSTKLGANTSASLSARRTEFDSTTSSDYTEHALVGTLSMTF